MASSEEQERERWLGAPPGGQTEIVLYCFPPSGVGASAFRKWSAEFPPSIAVRPVSFPGRERRMREAAISDFDTIIAQLTKVFSSLKDVRFAFFGHSLGALIAYECTRELQRQGHPLPVWLFLSNCIPPTLVDASKVRKPFDVVRMLKSYGPAGEQVLANPELFKIIEPVLQADASLVRSYKYGGDTAVPCPITVFGGKKDPLVSCEMLKGWADKTAAAFELKMIDADHFYLAGSENELGVINEVKNALGPLLRTP